jgi:hypothetical protein
MRIVAARLDDDLATWLKHQAAAVGWSESQLIRHILETTRGEDPEASAIKQVVWAIQAQILTNLSEVQQQIAGLLEKHVVAPWREGDGGQPPVERVAADPSPRVAAGPLPHEVERMAPESAELRGARSKRKRGTRGGRRG